MTDQLSDQTAQPNEAKVEAKVEKRDKVYVIPPHGRGKLVPWQKGQSGNPNQLNHAYNNARKICADASNEAALKQVALMSDPDPRVAFMATEAVLNRGVGKPKDHSADDATSSRIDISGLSTDERNSLAMLLKKALGM